MTSAGMPEQHDPAAGAGDPQAVGDRVAGADGVDRRRGRPTRAWSPIRWQPTSRRTARSSFGRLHDDVGADRLGERHLVRVAGADDDPHAGHVAAQAGDRSQAHRAGAEHGDDRIRRRRRSVGQASSAAWMPPANGSTSTARSSGMSSSMRWSCDSWAQNQGAQPPPVEQQKPVWIPGSTCRRRGRRGGRSRRRRRARRRRTADRSRARRGRAPVRGSRGCRRRVRRRPRGRARTGSSPSRRSRSTHGPRRARGRSRRSRRGGCGPGASRRPGSSGSSIVRSSSGPSLAAVAGATADAMRAMPNLATDRRICSAFTSPRHCCVAADVAAECAVDVRIGVDGVCVGLESWSVRRRRCERAGVTNVLRRSRSTISSPIGSSGRGRALGLRPVLDQPAALAGDRRRDGSRG